MVSKIQVKDGRHFVICHAFKGNAIIKLRQNILIYVTKYESGLINLIRLNLIKNLLQEKYRVTIKYLIHQTVPILCHV